MAEGSERVRAKSIDHFSARNFPARCGPPPTSGSVLSTSLLGLSSLEFLYFPLFSARSYRASARLIAPAKLVQHDAPNEEAFAGRKLRSTNLGGRLEAVTESRLPITAGDLRRVAASNCKFSTRGPFFGSFYLPPSPPPLFSVGSRLAARGSFILSSGHGASRVTSQQDRLNCVITVFVVEWRSRDFGDLHIDCDLTVSRRAGKFLRRPEPPLSLSLSLSPLLPSFTASRVQRRKTPDFSRVDSREIERSDRFGGNIVAILILFNENPNSPSLPESLSPKKIRLSGLLQLILLILVSHVRSEQRSLK